MRIAFFVTCLTDAFYPRAAIAAVKVLEHLGCRVEFPEAQTCCGQPMYNNGFHDEARALALRMFTVFEPYDWIVTPSGSCAAMVREHFLELFEHDPAGRQRAEAFATRTREFVEFLVNTLQVDLARHPAGPPRWPGRVTYHYSCHLRGLGVTDEAVRLMEQVEGLEYAPLDKKEQCCGFGGTFAVKFPMISGSLVRDKVECVRGSGATTLISNDAGCTMNIAGGCRRAGLAVGTLSLAEILAEGWGLLPYTGTPGGAT